MSKSNSKPAKPAAPEKGISVQMLEAGGSCVLNPQPVVGPCPCDDCPTAAACALGRACEAFEHFVLDFPWDHASRAPTVARFDRLFRAEQQVVEAKTKPTVRGSPPIGRSLEMSRESERKRIRAAIVKHGGPMAAARALGMNPAQLLALADRRTLSLLMKELRPKHYFGGCRR